MQAKSLYFTIWHPSSLTNLPQSTDTCKIGFGNYRRCDYQKIF